MALDPAVIGRELPPVDMHVERGRLRLFCLAIGETDPVYVDVDAARESGHPDLLVPPTFFCAIEHERRPHSFGWLRDLGVDPARVLHGEQSFTYHALAYARDHLSVRSWIRDVYSKKNGALDFIVREAQVSRGDTRVADLRDTIVVTRPEVLA